MMVRGRRRAQRLAVMVLVAGLSGLALLAQPARRDGTTTARVAAIVPVASGVGPARDAAAGAPPAQPAAPTEAAADMGSADPAAIEAAERETDPTLPPVLEPGDIVVALAAPPPAESALQRVTFVHTSESAQPEGPPPADGAADSGEGAEGPEPGALYWFGPAGLVRLAREAQR